MELAFKVRITIGNDLANWNYSYFVFDYEPSTQDYEEFAKHCGWNNALELLTCSFDENDKDEYEEIKDVKHRLETGDTWLLESNLDKRTEELFKEWLANKYQEKVERYLAEDNLVKRPNDDTLNDILKA